MEEHKEKYQDAEKKLRKEEARIFQMDEQMTIIRQREKDANSAIDPLAQSIREKQAVTRDAKRVADDASGDINTLKNEISNINENVERATVALERERQKHSIDRKYDISTS